MKLSAITADTGGKRADIEGLRALAVLAVVAFHFGMPGVTGGFIGVDIFFVISGYVITAKLARELDRAKTIDLLGFYAGRMRRLLPAALLMTVATLGAGMLILAPLEQQSTGKAAGWAGLYFSNVYFMLQPRDYFAPETALNPFLHTWSLAVEEQFYLVWPTLVLLAFRFRWFRDRPHIWIGALCAASFALCVWWTYRSQPTAFYASPARAWEFGLGALASLPAARDWAVRSKAMPAIGWISAAIIGTCIFTFSEAAPFPGWIATIPAIATAAILLSGLGSSGPRVFLELAPMQWLGQLSYSIYLWHWPVIVFATILFPDLGAVVILGCCALTLACAATSFYGVEHPVREARWLKTRTGWSLVLGGVLTGMTAASGAAVYLAGKHFAAEPAQARIASAAKEMPIASGRKCLLEPTASAPRTCAFGNSASTRTIVLFGDSHADQWSTPLAELAARNGWKLVTYLKASCPVSEVPAYNSRLRRYMPECDEWRARSLAEIAELRPALVVASQFSSGYIRGPKSTLGRFAVTYEQWENGLRRSLAKLGAPVLLLRDSPSPGPVDPAICVQRALWRGQPVSSCDVPRSLAIDARLTALERGVAVSTPGVRFADLTDALCDDRTCPVVRNGELVYRDANHLTVGYAVRMGAALAADLTPSPL